MTARGAAERKAPRRECSPRSCVLRLRICSAKTFSPDAFSPRGAQEGARGRFPSGFATTSPAISAETCAAERWRLCPVSWHGGSAVPCPDRPSPHGKPGNESPAEGFSSHSAGENRCIVTFQKCKNQQLWRRGVEGGAAHGGWRSQVMCGSCR